MELRERVVEAMRNLGLMDADCGENDLGDVADRIISLVRSSMVEEKRQAFVDGFMLGHPFDPLGDQRAIAEGVASQRYKEEVEK